MLEEKRAQTIKKIASALEMQDKLNNATNGEDWKKGFTREGRLINWSKCIYAEAVEANLDSIPWKHWKDINAAPDIDNIKIETVDIWHFLLSSVLEEDFHFRTVEMKKEGEVEDNPLDYEHIAEGLEEVLIDVQDRFVDATNICKEQGYQLACSDQNRYFLPKDNKFWINNTVCSWKDVIVKHLEVLTRDAIMASLTSSIEDRYKINRKITRDFFAVMLSLGMDTDELYALYMSKNVLNTFRQDHNYKNNKEDMPKYIKLWGKDEVEDNVFIQQFLSTNPDATSDEIYGYLENKYRELNT